MVLQLGDHTASLNTSPGPAGFWSLSVSLVLVLRLLLGALTVSTGVGVWYAVARRPAFQGAFPGTADDRVYGAMLLTAALGFVALVALWFWRRWGAWLYGLVALSSIVLDLAVRAPFVHQLSAAISAGLVLGLVFVNRRRFHEARRIAPGGS